MGFFPKGIDVNDLTVSMQTMEAGAYLLQRMQVGGACRRSGGARRWLSWSVQGTARVGLRMPHKHGPGQLRMKGWAFGVATCLLPLGSRLMCLTTRSLRCTPFSSLGYLPQVCLDAGQKEDLHLATHLRTCANLFVELIKAGLASGQAAAEAAGDHGADPAVPALAQDRADGGMSPLEVALWAVRELAWDDQNLPVEPGLSVMAEAGIFDAVAGLLDDSECGLRQGRERCFLGQSFMVQGLGTPGPLRRQPLQGTC